MSDRTCNSLDVDGHLLSVIPSIGCHTERVPLKTGDAGHVQKHETEGVIHQRWGPWNFELDDSGGRHARIGHANQPTRLPTPHEAIEKEQERGAHGVASRLHPNMVREAGEEDDVELVRVVEKIEMPTPDHGQRRGRHVDGNEQGDEPGKHEHSSRLGGGDGDQPVPSAFLCVDRDERTPMADEDREEKVSRPLVVFHGLVKREAEYAQNRRVSCHWEEEEHDEHNGDPT